MFLVAYDISDPARLRNVHNAMLGFGDPLQYSVFSCDFSPSERVLLRGVLIELIHRDEDRVIIVDLGPVGETTDGRFEFLGFPMKTRSEGPLLCELADSFERFSATTLNFGLSKARSVRAWTGKNKKGMELMMYLC